jgi:gliding motility-associated-like protein
MAGQQYIYSFNGPAGFIRGSKKIALLHISGSTDQVAGAVIPSLECTGSNQVGFTRPGSGEFRLTLTIKNGFQNNFKLNGNPLDGSGFQPVPGTNGEWVYLNRVFTTAEVPTGKASLITNFSAELFHMGTAYRQGASCNYGYFSDFSYLNLGTNRSVCLSDSTILDAGPGKTKYLWSTGDTTQKIVVKTPGIYTVDVLSGNECAAKDTIEVSFYGPVVNIQQSRDTICEGTQLLLTVPGNYLFQWQDGVTTSSTYLASDSGLYWVEVTDYQGCKARDSARVYTAPRPTTPVATIVPFGPEISADTLCAGESLSLRMSNIEGASSYSWLQQTAQGSNIIPGQQLDLNNLKTTNSGTYLASVTINGCESLSDTLKILVNPTPEVNLLFTDTVCDSQTVTLDAGAGSGYTYEWQDGSSNQTFLASTKGLYWVEVENPEGCAKRDSVDLYFSVIPTAPEISISDVVANSDSLCAGEKLELSIPEKDQVSYFWITPGGSTVSPGKDLIIDAAVLQNSGKYYAFYSKDGCKSSLDSVDIFIAVSPEFSFGAADTSICGKDTLFLSAASGGDITYLWSDNSTDSLSGPITESGTWWVRLTNTIGCSVSDTVNVNFALLPKPEISISDVVTNSDSLCSGEKLMLSIPQQEEVTYSWTIPGGNTVNQGADFIVESVELQNSGKYYAFYTKSGCKSLIDSVDIVVGVSPVFSFNISDTSICGIDTIFLSAPSDPGLSYLWNDNSTDSLSGPITISGAWWVKITNSIGCSVTDTVKVDFRPLPDPVITGQTVVCIGDPLNLNVVPENGVKYFWKGPSFNSSDTSISVGNPQSGAIYSLWAENNGCYSKDTIEVTVILQPLPVVNLGQDVTICNGASLELTGPENVHRYFWSNGDTSRSTSFGPGQVVLTVRNIQGCSASDTLLISGSSPTAAFTSSPTGGALVNIPIAFTDQSTGNPVTWSWNFGNGQNATVQNPVNPFPVKGSYTVTLVITDSNGCTDTTSAVYVIEGEIAVPNSFTPNSDGKNDFFVVKGLEGFPDSDLKVFNRWGSEVFASNAYQNNWDGGDSPDGVYYYVLRLKNGQELKGDITLKRQ